jgi:hypothetical protein
MDDRVPSDKLRPLFTHQPLSRRDTLKEDTRHPQDASPTPLDAPAGPALLPSSGPRPPSVAASTLVQPGVDGSATQNRPSNSWLRYRRLKQVELASLGLKMGELSKVIAKMWREEPQDIKDFHKAQCQEQWASDRANGYQYRQPKMPLPGEPRAKKGRSGPWRKTQRPLLGPGSGSAEIGGQLNPSSAPPQVHRAVAEEGEIPGPESSSATRATLSGNPNGEGSRDSPYARPSRLPSDSGGIHEVALYRSRALHPSTTSSNPRANNNLSSSTSSSVYPPDDDAAGLSPPQLATEHKREPTEYEFSPPRSEDEMAVDLGVPLAPIIPDAAQSPLSDAAQSSPAPAAPAAPRGITLPSLRHDPILGRALELPPVHDYFMVCSSIVKRGFENLV